MSTDERIAVLEAYLVKAKASDWVEVVFASDFTMMLAKVPDDVNAAFVAVSNLPGYPTSRWLGEDFGGLGSIIRAVVIGYFERKIEELKKSK